ncbi:MAG: LPXTG cell wall anchor domain-containing protein [Lachnospiraceae bacterium]|nr:LPXTG cell wall anchor domain-containing protein [Lachnospiraceae bacterium]
MKNWKWKKILSIVLAALLVVALLPNTVNASDTDVSDGTAQIRTITLDGDGNIIASSDGTVTDDQAGSQDDQTAVIADTNQSDTNAQTDQTGDGEQTDQTDTNETDTGTQAGETSTDTDQTGSDTSTGSSTESSSDGSNVGEDGDNSESGTEASTDDTQSSTDESGANAADDVDADEEADSSAFGSDTSTETAQSDADSGSGSESSGSESGNTDSESESAEASQSESITTETFTVENSTTEASAVSSTSETIADEAETEDSEELSDEDKTLTVDASSAEVEGESYTTIQGAINYIYALDISNDVDAKEGWIIYVESGKYNRFTVLSGLDGLTIQAAADATVTISTWDGTTSEDGSVPKKQESYYLYNGIYIMSQNVTLKGLTINVGLDVDVSCDTTLREGLSDFDLPNSSCWYIAGIRTTRADSADGLVVDSCKFTSSIQGDDSNTNYGILTACYSFTVKNSTFEGFWQGISVMGDYYAVDDVSITGNIFTNCNRAISIYYKVAPENTENMGTLSITNNTITGSSNVRSKIILHDVYSNGSMGNVTLSGNTFSYGFVLIVNFAESPDTINGQKVASGKAKAEVFKDNTWTNGSFYVESSEYYNSESGYTGTISADFPELAFYESPEDDIGYWVLNTDLDSSPYTGSYENPAGTTEYVQSVIDAANAEGSHTLSFTFDDEDQLIWTLTAFKDAIYWFSGKLPDLTKSIAGEDGTETPTEAEETDAAAGDTVTYKLTSRVPSSLSEYIDYTYVNGVLKGTVQTETVTDDDENETSVNKTYNLIFVDEMDSYLTLDTSSIVVMVGDTNLTNYKDESGNPVSYYSVTVTEPTTEDTTSSDESDDSSEDSEDTEASESIRTFTVTIDLLALYTDGIIMDTDIEENTPITVTYSATLSEDAPAGSYNNTAYVTYPEGQSAEDTTQVNSYGLRIYKYDLGTLSTGGNENAVPSGENSTPLANAVFYLCDENRNRISGTLITGEDGYVEFTTIGLSGTYYLVEYAAPTGYVATDKVNEITIPGDNVGEKGSCIVTVQVANAAIPQTGGMGTQPFTVAGIAILLLAGLAYVVTRRRVY